VPTCYLRHEMECRGIHGKHARSGTIQLKVEMRVRCQSRMAIKNEACVRGGCGAVSFQPRGVTEYETSKITKSKVLNKSSRLFTCLHVCLRVKNQGRCGGGRRLRRAQSKKKAQRMLGEARSMLHGGMSVSAWWWRGAARRP